MSRIKLSPEERLKNRKETLKRYNNKESTKLRYKEWKQNNPSYKEKHNKYGKLYRIKNKDKCSLYAKQYSQNPENKTMLQDRSLRFYHRDKNRAKNSRLKFQYNITLEEYNKLFEIQEGKCRICGRHQTTLNRALDVDHDHNTNQVRGLLCTTCNTKLGWYEKHKDNINQYLEEC